MNILDSEFVHRDRDMQTKAVSTSYVDTKPYQY